MTIDWSKYAQAPFEEKGRGPAYDCWGLVCAVYENEMGIRLPAFDDRYLHTRDRQISEIVFEASRRWQKVERPEPGDVIVIRINGLPLHVGIVVRPGEMIHILHGAQVCIESYETPMWRNRIDGFYRHRPDHR